MQQTDERDVLVISSSMYAKIASVEKQLLIIICSVNDEYVLLKEQSAQFRKRGWWFLWLFRQMDVFLNRNAQSVICNNDNQNVRKTLANTRRFTGLGYLRFILTVRETLDVIHCCTSFNYVLKQYIEIDVKWCNFIEPFQPIVFDWRSTIFM